MSLYVFLISFRFHIDGRNQQIPIQFRRNCIVVYFYFHIDSTFEWLNQQRSQHFHIHINSKTPHYEHLSKQISNLIHFCVVLHEVRIKEEVNFDGCKKGTENVIFFLMTKKKNKLIAKIKRNFIDLVQI